MNHSFIVPFILAFFICQCCFASPLHSTVKDSLLLWYKEPAANWNEALPLGNGRLGAMVFGGVTNERIQLNEETIWTKGGEYLDKKDGHTYIDEIRNLLFDGKYVEAEKLAKEKLMGERLPSGTNTYQTLGDLKIAFEGLDTYQDYYRDLDLSSATANMRFRVGKTWHHRKVFSSAVDQAIVFKAWADAEAAINCSVRLSRPGEGELISIRENRIIMTQHLSDGNGVKFEARVLVEIDGGSLDTKSNELIITEADALEIRIIVGSDYFGNDPKEVCDHYENQLALRKYDDILADHIKDFSAIFGRVSLDIPPSDAAAFATNERVDAQNRGVHDPSMAALYFQFGRYLLISSSRPGGLPANLQGIWADGLTPPWNSDYHININIQMNYWLSEIGNLSECHLPFLNFIDALRGNGRKTARELYAAEGFTAHHTTDAWHYTTSFGLPQYGLWPMGAAWASTHMWEHYLFTEDREFLEKLGYPVMREAALFLSTFLVEDPKTGLLVTGPSMSPENIFLDPAGNRASVVMGPAMDLQIVRHLFKACIKSAEILDIDLEFKTKLENQLKNLTPVKIGKNGRILEWSDEALKEALPGHRHMSHLYGLYPSNEFNWKTSPELVEASKEVIKHRLENGGGHTGWSLGWIMNFYARLNEGDKLWEGFQGLLSKKSYPNLFDAHPPFQIDGNFGAASAIAESLIQSHTAAVELLPALPSALPEGKVAGLMARGGFEVDMEWSDGKLTEVSILSKLGNPLKLKYGNKIIDLDIKKIRSYSTRC